MFQPGGGQVKIENRKLEWQTNARYHGINQLKGQPDENLNFDSRIYTLRGYSPRL